MSRDSQTDSSRTGKDRKSRESFMRDVPFAPGTVWDRKKQDKKMGLRGSETRGASDVRAAGDG